MAGEQKATCWVLGKLSRKPPVGGTVNLPGGVTSPGLPLAPPAAVLQEQEEKHWDQEEILCHLQCPSRAGYWQNITSWPVAREVCLQSPSLMSPAGPGRVDLELGGHTSITGSNGTLHSGRASPTRCVTCKSAHIAEFQWEHSTENSQLFISSPVCSPQFYSRLEAAAFSEDPLVHSQIVPVSSSVYGRPFSSFILIVS